MQGLETGPGTTLHNVSTNEKLYKLHIELYSMIIHSNIYTRNLHSGSFLSFMVRIFKPYYCVHFDFAPSKIVTHPQNTRSAANAMMTTVVSAWKMAVWHNE